MIFKIAWRNIWRQKTRSIVIIASIAVGIWAGIMMTGLATGMIESYVSDSILDIYSHLQIHHPKFGEEFELQYKVSTDDHFRNILDKNVDIANFSERTIVVGMANTSRNARSARLVGIDPSKEVEMTSIHKKLKEGEYLNRDDNNKILVSQRMADKMNVKLRSKIILTFQDANADIVASAYRIKGIYQTNNQLFDENHVFVLKHELDELVYQSESNEVSNEIALILKDKDELEMVKSDLIEQFPDLKVESYKDLSPDINLYESQIENISIIYLVIIMLALIFGIINTMLMAVLERVRELGMLMAIGMTKVRIFSLIVIEAVLLGIIAAPIGLLIAYVSISLLSQSGIHLDQFVEGMRRFGISSVIYPSVPVSAYINVVLAVVITSILASLYPAVKARNLNPVEAIRQI